MRCKLSSAAALACSATRRVRSSSAALAATRLLAWRRSDSSACALVASAVRRAASSSAAQLAAIARTWRSSASCAAEPAASPAGRSGSDGSGIAARLSNGLPEPKEKGDELAISVEGAGT